MEQKPILLWLSADRRQNKVHQRFANRWQVMWIHPGEPLPAQQRTCGSKLIGVCDLASLTPGQYAHIDQWLEQLPASSWLGLVQPGQMDNPQVRRLIQDYCQDYHTLPIDWRRLRFSLGHMLSLIHI